MIITRKFQKSSGGAIPLLIGAVALLVVIGLAGIVIAKKSSKAPTTSKTIMIEKAQPPSPAIIAALQNIF